MSTAESRQAVASIRTAPFSPAPPAWAVRLFDGGTTTFTEHRQMLRANDLILISLSYSAKDLDGDEFEALVATAYRTLRAEVRGGTSPHPLRIWNFIPGILDPAGDSVDRYMRFNAGRYWEFLQWFGDASVFDQKVPAASAVGHDGNNFILHALCGSDAATSIANPRQRAAHRYTKRFGPVPPCFARAVMVGSSSNRQLVIGGTASVVDETSIHIGQLDLQLIETSENLAALVRAAFGNSSNAANCIDHLRAYHVKPGDRAAVEQFLRTTYPKLKSLEFHVGDLCRGDLLVEVEGHASQPH